MHKSILCLFVFAIAPFCFPQDDYQQWLKKEQEKFTKYISEEDQKFSEFLKKDWVSVGLKKVTAPLVKPKPTKQPEVKTETGEKKAEPNPPVVPKEVLEQRQAEENDVPPPVVTPQAETKNVPQPVKETKTLEPQAETVVTPPSTPAPPPREAPAPNIQPVPISRFVVPFYNSSLTYRLPKSFAITINKPVNNEFFADYWQAMSQLDYKSCIEQSQLLQKTIRLNDWAYCNLLYDLAKTIYPANNNYRVIFTWYMLIKSGYRARAAYRGDDIFLLLETKNKIYGNPYFSGNNDLRFYLMSLEPISSFTLDNIYIYQEDFPGADRPFDFNIRELPSINDSTRTRLLDLTIDGKKVRLNLVSNAGLIKFFEYYPQTDYPVYFTAPLSKAASESLLPGLQKCVTGMATRDALNFLLHFVQRATYYKLDEEQFGREKPLFAEESLFYSYSDCEDRSVLFAYLVKKILSLNVVGIYYPEHVATAVELPGEPGDHILYLSKKYLICDPTYMGANIGMCMPDYRSVKPEIINY